MAKFSLKLPEINEEALSDQQAIRKILSYLYQLNEQLRYMMMNLDEDNIASGAISENTLAPDLKNMLRNFTVREDGLAAQIRVTAAQISTTMSSMIGDFSQISQTAGSITEAVQNALGDYSLISQEATSITEAVRNALGDYSLISQEATSITEAVRNALGDYSVLSQEATSITQAVQNKLGDYSTQQQTADAISAYVSSNAYGLVSGVDIKAEGVEISGGKYVKIKSGGTFEVDSGNFSIDSSGNVSMSGNIDASTGSIGGFGITSTQIGSLSEGIYMRKDIYDNGSLLIPGGFLINASFTTTEGIPHVFEAWRNGEVGIIVGRKTYFISDGWIKDITKDDGVLTITKYDGTTITYP